METENWAKHFQLRAFQEWSDHRLFVQYLLVLEKLLVLIKVQTISVSLGDG